MMACGLEELPVLERAPDLFVVFRGLLSGRALELLLDDWEIQRKSAGSRLGHNSPWTVIKCGIKSVLSRV